MTVSVFVSAEDGDWGTVDLEYVETPAVSRGNPTGVIRRLVSATSSLGDVEIISEDEFRIGGKVFLRDDEV